MTAKNLYDLLGVPPNATPEQIRQAYVLRSKMLHPDRFNQTRQRAEWELANEMLKELNHAYGVLRDSASRAQYDRTIPGTSTRQPPPQQPPPRHESQPPPQPTVKLGRLKSGSGCFDSLPRTAQQRLIERASGTNKVQYAIKLAGVGWNYFWTILFIGWFVFLFYQASESRWDGDTFGWLIGITGVVALLQALNLNWIVRWHKSPLRCWFLVTPLYIIKTHLDRVWYWPIWEVSDIKATHNYKNGVYQGTSLHMAFGSASEDLTISPQSAYDSMLSALRAFDQKFRSAKSQQDWMYFFEQDDFREFDPETTPPRPRRAPARTAGIFVLSFALYGISFAIAAAVNGDQAPRPKYTYTPNPPASASSYAPTIYRTPRPARPAFVRPATAPNGQPWPAYAAYIPGNQVLAGGGLSSVTVDNTQNSSDVFLKLVSLNSGQAYPVRLCYIPAYSQFKFPSVAAGRYDVRYRDLSSGGYSKTEEFTLTETKNYQGTEFSNLSLTLYKVSNGNMHTETIDESEF